MHSSAILDGTVVNETHRAGFLKSSPEFNSKPDQKHLGLPVTL